MVDCFTVGAEGLPPGQRAGGPSRGNPGRTQMIGVKLEDVFALHFRDGLGAEVKVFLFKLRFQ